MGKGKVAGLYDGTDAPVHEAEAEISAGVREIPVGD